MIFFSLLLMVGSVGGEAKRGKVEDFMSAVVKQYQETALEIDGYTYQIETYMTIPEAYEILGMEPPPE